MYFSGEPVKSLNMDDITLHTASPFNKRCNVTAKTSPFVETVRGLSSLGNDSLCGKVGHYWIQQLEVE